VGFAAFSFVAALFIFLFAMEAENLVAEAGISDAGD